jgi:serine protease
MHRRNLCLRKITLGLIVAMTGEASQAIEPNDPLFSSTYMYPSYYQWGMRTLNMEEAWNYARGHAYLAPLDAGIQTNHPDLQNNFRAQFSRKFAPHEDLISENVDELPTTGLSTGHGTHVSGILAASSNNQIGVVGTCWDCSLMIGKITGVLGNSSKYEYRTIANGLDWMIKTGAQVVNMSFGSSLSDVFGTDDFSNCSEVITFYRNTEYSTEQKKTHALRWCEALDRAEEFDVVLVAAAGNESDQNIDFPASDDRVIAVGAIDFSGNVSAWSSDGPEKDLVAPGEDVLSTFYTDRIWNPDMGCSDNLSAPSGYGPCTGTSMASPHVAGIVGILRSINPLLKRDQIKESLTKHSSNRDLTNDRNVYGYGIPDAAASVKDVLGKSNSLQLVNRVTPLFSFTSSTALDSFYTTSPQMAMAAMYGAMQPQPSAGTVNWVSIGADTPGYRSFPKPGFWWSEVPKANAYIMTTHRNPFIVGAELDPLYRLSRQRTHGSNNKNVDHTYTTSQYEMNSYVADDYQLDGIEGYIFPYQETGTVRLYRRYNPTRDDHAIFPESMLSYMNSQGYTQNGKLLGYVYPNQDSDWDGLVDGFEMVVGTSISDRDSDDDGVTDGDEVNKYPYGDPLVP